MKREDIEEHVWPDLEDATATIVATIGEDDSIHVDIHFDGEISPSTAALLATGTKESAESIRRWALEEATRRDQAEDDDGGDIHPEDLDSAGHGFQ